MHDNHVSRARNLLHRKGYGRLRHVHDDANAVIVEPVACDRRADIRLGLVISGNNFDRAAEYLAAEISDRHLAGQHRTRPHDVLVHAGHVGQDPDLDWLLAVLGQRWRRQRPADQKHRAKRGRESN